MDQDYLTIKPRPPTPRRTDLSPLVTFSVTALPVRLASKVRRLIIEPAQMHNNGTQNTWNQAIDHSGHQSLCCREN